MEVETALADQDRVHHARRLRGRLFLQVGIQVGCDTQFAVAEELTHLHSFNASGSATMRRCVEDRGNDRRELGGCENGVEDAQYARSNPALLKRRRPAHRQGAAAVKSTEATSATNGSLKPMTAR